MKELSDERLKIAIAALRQIANEAAHQANYTAVAALREINAVSDDSSLE